jgi:hypothetical protein
LLVGSVLRARCTFTASGAYQPPHQQTFKVPQSILPWYREISGWVAYRSRRFGQRRIHLLWDPWSTSGLRCVVCSLSPGHSETEQCHARQRGGEGKDRSVDMSGRCVTTRTAPVPILTTRTTVTPPSPIRATLLLSLFITADFCSWPRRGGKRGGCCIPPVRSPKNRPRYRQAMNRSARARLDDPHFHATFGPSRPREGALREASHEQDGMRRPAGLLHASNPPGGVRQHRPSATTSGTCECTNARPTGTAHVHRPEVLP